MSDPGLSRRLEDIEARAAAFVRRRHFWDWSEEDQAALDSWLEESISHRVAYWRMESGFERTEKLVALGHPSAEAPKPERRFPLLIGIAAALVLVTAVSFGALRFFAHPQDRIYTTPVGGHEQIAFADGSKIELNTDTVLRARMTTDQRTIWLEKGEAFFQVKHDAAHPFIVMVGDRRVTDLGTAFLVRRDDSRMEVAVVQGRVRFDSAGAYPAKQTAMLTPGDVVTAAGATMVEAKKSAVALSNELGWRRGVLVFDNMTLAAAAEEFNRYNRRKIVITDPAAARLAMVGTFPINNVTAFVDAAEDIFKLRVENRDSEIVISR